MGKKLFAGSIAAAVTATMVAGLYAAYSLGMRAASPPVQQSALSQPSSVSERTLEALLKDAYIVPVGMNASTGCFSGIMQGLGADPYHTSLANFAIVGIDESGNPTFKVNYFLVVGKLPKDTEPMISAGTDIYKHMPSPEDVKNGRAPFPVRDDLRIRGEFAKCEGRPF